MGSEDKVKQITTHFHEKEFQCSCGCHLVEPLKLDFVNKLERARMYAQIPFIINSGVRCKEHNASKHVGGVDSSAHVRGYACDIRIKDSHERFIIQSALIKTGFTRFGIAHSYIHVDSDPAKPEEVEWVY